MYEVYVLVARKKSAQNRFLSVFLLVLGVLAFLFSFATASLAFVCLAIVFLAGWYLVAFRSFKEYEYSFFDGECRFAKIMNKSRRKKLNTFTMDDVLQIAPTGDRSVYKYEHDQSVKVIDYTSGETGVPSYDMVFKNGESLSLIKFEPDDAYLDAVCVKYGMKVVRRPQ